MQGAAADAYRAVAGGCGGGGGVAVGPCEVCPVLLGTGDVSLVRAGPVFADVHGQQSEGLAATHYKDKITAVSAS